MTEVNFELNCNDEETSDARRKILGRALELGASDEVLVEIRDARRVKRNSATCVLPAHRLEGLSRGKGYCGKREGRRIKGPFDEFAERVDGGYEVGPGRWWVGGSDGFSRKGVTDWEVWHVQVGAETWTLAS